MKKLIKNKNYILLFFGSLVSFLGDKIQDIGLMWYIYSSMHSPIMASISLIVNFLPKIIFAPLAGMLSDKSNRKYIIVICDFLNGISAIILGIMIYYKVNIYVLFIVTFIMSTLDIIFSTTSMSIIPDIVEDNDLISANSLSSMLNNVISIVGPSLAGILYAIKGPTILFMVNGCSFIISAIFELFIKYKHIKKINVGMNRERLYNKIVKLFIEYSDGFKIIINDRFLFFNAIIGGGIVNFFLAPISVYIPVCINDKLKLSSVYFGIMNSAITIGSIVASFIMILLGKKFNKYLVVTIGFIMQGISLILFGVFNDFTGGFISLTILGIGLSITGINMNTIVQQKIPPEVLGRCISAVMIISNITVPTGYLLGGYMVQFISLTIILVFSGIIVLICGISSNFIYRKQNYIKQ